MTHGAASGLLLLAFAALGLFLWLRLWPGTQARRAPYMALAVLSAACAGAAAPLWAPLATRADAASTRLDALAATVFLLMLALTWSRRPTPPSSHDPRLWAALQLLQAAGGLLALCSPDLLGAASGLVLFHMAGLAEGVPQHRSLVGALAALPCLALVYLRQGSLDVATLNVSLWQHGGPAPLPTYLGIGLLIGALMAQLWLAADRASGQGQPELALLSLVLLRMRLFAAGAWVWEWRWGLTAVALLWILWGVWQGGRARNTRGGLIVLARMQAGFVLAAVAVSDSPSGLLAALLSILTLSLGYATLAITLPRLPLAEEPDCSDVPTGLVWQHPWRGVPLLVGILTLAAMAPLPGFGARYAWVTAQYKALGPVWSWVGLVLSLLGALVYLPWIISLLRRAGPPPQDAIARAPGPLAWVLALFLILMSLWAYAGPRLIGWIIA